MGGHVCAARSNVVRCQAAAGGIPPLIAAGRRHKQALRAVQALSAAADVKGAHAWVVAHASLSLTRRCCFACADVWVAGDVVAHGGLDMLADACSHKELRLAQVAVSALANLAIGSTKRAVSVGPASACGSR